MDAVASSMYGDHHRSAAAIAAASLQPTMSHMNHVSGAHSAMYGHSQPSNHVANHVMGSVPDVHKRDKDLIYG